MSLRNIIQKNWDGGHSLSLQAYRLLHCRTCKNASITTAVRLWPASDKLNVISIKLGSKNERCPVFMRLCLIFFCKVNKVTTAPFTRNRFITIRINHYSLLNDVTDILRVICHKNSQCWLFLVTPVVEFSLREECLKQALEFKQLKIHTP